MPRPYERMYRPPATPCMITSMKILILLAGTNHPSNSEVLAGAFAEGMRKLPDTEVETIRVSDLNLEHFTLDHYKPETNQGADYEKVRTALTNASGVVIASPIWNFSVPAHLKNLIDRMGAFGLDSETRSRGTFGGKPFYFLFTGGAPLPAWKGLMRFTTMHVSEAMRFFGASILGKHFEGKATVGKGKFGLILDQRPDHLAKAREKGELFAGDVQRFAKEGILPLRTRIVTKLYRFGQRILGKL